MKKLLARLVRQSPAMIVAMLALFVALTGTAVATTSALITGAQIKNSSITGLDVKNRSLRPIDFRGSVRGPRGLRGLTGAPGAPGAKGDKGDKGDTGAPGSARAYGSIASDGSVSVFKPLALKNATVRKPAATTGVYCITPTAAAGITDLNTTVPIVSPDYSYTGENTVAMIRSSGANCTSASEYTVQTWNASTGAALNAGFSFVIP